MLQKIKKVLCWGSFDILHKGHIKFFEDAKKQGDYLIVIVISDKAIYENKGKYPTNNQKQRAKELKKLKIIDKVLEFSNNLDDNFKLIESINPEVIVFGYDQKTSIEKKLKQYLSYKRIFPKYYISKEFSGGVHSSHLRKCYKK